MLTVVETNCSDRQGTVIVQGSTMEEVMSADAKKLALQAAGSRISRPGISGSPSAYPVDSAGETSDDLMMGRGQVAGYRVDYPITGGL
jgi:uncharacterized protein (DUF111 family)